MLILQGSYVRHAKLPELGVGEVLSVADGKVGIRFGSGLRSFLHELVAPHLTMTTEAPVFPPQSKARKAAAAKR